MKRGLSLVIMLLGMTFGASARSPFEVLAPTNVIQLNPGGEAVVPVTIQIPSKYFIYQDKTGLDFVELQGLKVKDVRYPPSREHLDPFFGKKVQIFEGDVEIQAVLQAPSSLAPGQKIVEAMLRLQGCSDTLCYPEESHLVSFTVKVLGQPVAVQEPAKEGVGSLGTLLASQNFSAILEHGWGMVLLIVFLGGFLTALTPCVLPIIPITLMIIGVRAETPLRRNLLLSGALVLGLALTYAGLGVFAVAFGKTLGFFFQQQWFVIAVASLFFALALSMFGLFEIRLPQSLSVRLQQIKGHGLMGAFVSGAATGVLAAPCAGPVVGALLLFVAGTKSYLQGFGLLFVFALGMGFLFLILGSGYGTLAARFRGGSFTIWIKRLLGVILLIGSLFYLNTVVPLQKFFARPVKSVELVHWYSTEPAGLAVAKKEGKIILLDFYADWCAPCKELEIGFFREPETVELLQKMVPVRINATFAGDPVVEALLDKYNVVGWPTILFVKPDGAVLEDLSVVSYNPELLLKNMKQAVAK